MKDIALFKTKDAFFFKKIHSKNELIKLKESEIKEINGFLIDSEEKEARRIIESLKSSKLDKLVAIKGKDDSFNRRAIETLKINFLVLDLKNKKDTLKQRDSGMNHVTAKEALKKSIIIVIDLSELVSENKEERARILSRIMQNIVLCRKTKCKLKFVTLAEKKEQLKDEYSIKSLATSLGMSSQQVRESTEF